jgi:hypothetical protein
MITFYRIGAIAPGKNADMMAFAKEIAGYFKATYGVELEVRMPIGGNPMRIGWASRYKDLAALDATTMKMLGDKKYMEMTAKGTDLFIPGSLQDSIWRTV